MKHARIPSLHWVSLAVLVASGSPAAAAPQVVEVGVTPATIFDFEFDYTGNRFAWISPEDEIWVGYVDPATGAFTPPDGKAELVDPLAVFEGNGPEWVASTGGNGLVYNKAENGVTKVGVAAFNGTSWNNTIVPFSDREFSPFGNPEPVLGLTPFLSIQVTPTLPPRKRLVWHLLEMPVQPVVVPMSVGTTGGRWVPGEPEIVYTAPVGGIRQAFLYDGLTNTSAQLTFDGGTKQGVFLWEAPEFGGERLLFASVKGNTLSQIRVYRLLDPDGDGQFTWTAIKTLNPPAQGLYFWSPECFVHNGKSYIFWVVSQDPDQPDPAFPTQIWIAAADPANSFYKNLSNPAEPRYRADPEVFVTSAGPLLYYARFFPGTPQQYEGVFAANTGLGPVQ